MLGVLEKSLAHFPDHQNHFSLRALMAEDFYSVLVKMVGMSLGSVRGLSARSNKSRSLLHIYLKSLSDFPGRACSGYVEMVKKAMRQGDVGADALPASTELGAEIPCYIPRLPISITISASLQSNLTCNVIHTILQEKSVLSPTASSRTKCHAWIPLPTHCYSTLNSTPMSSPTEPSIHHGCPIPAVGSEEPKWSKSGAK